ncbi:MerR family transcriptional regulator [Acinetobacter sp. B5B]|uniref:MerR family transcriptional regulator n=1 Tax=Acinetobacter baretiae TaxID=2605383 RepID=UPI0018C2F1CD|nr:MerR family transcriptional regulator [Acinetobacter baretiae]MBF7681939.1 MerR family transcriptional regulator [Acinetobacter baretiae]MBF7685689.1 MerR family transcriptional regulator [Acinetobacter baretiae]
MQFTIGELAKKAKLSADTIRFYEKKQLIRPPLRADNNYRYYDQDSLTRLVFIRHCRELGMSLKEIQALHEQLQEPEQNCVHVNEVIRDHLHHVTEKINQLEQFKVQLEQLEKSCQANASVKDCEIIQALQRPDDRDDPLTLSRLDLHA